MPQVLGGEVCPEWSISRRSATAVLIVFLVTILLGGTRGLAQTPDALPFSKGFLVTGNYTVGSVDVNPKAAAGGLVSGTISMNGVPADGEIVAAYLYWEMISTNVAQVDGALFRGSPITVVKASPLALNPANAPCWSSGGG